MHFPFKENTFFKVVVKITIDVFNILNANIWVRCTINYSYIYIIVVTNSKCFCWFWEYKRVGFVVSILRNNAVLSNSLLDNFKSCFKICIRFEFQSLINFSL